MFISVNFHTYMTSQKVSQNPLKKLVLGDQQTDLL